MEPLGALIGAGLATAFVLSVLEYFDPRPLLRASIALIASLTSVLLLAGITWMAVPLSLGATFLGVFLYSLVTGGERPSQKGKGSRIPRL